MKLPFKSSGAILTINRGKFNVPLKDVNCVFNNGYKIGISKVKDPYGFKYMPDLIDVYPNDKKMNPGVAMVNN